jgi:hypothetical protein
MLSLLGRQTDGPSGKVRPMPITVHALAEKRDTTDQVILDLLAHVLEDHSADEIVYRSDVESPSDIELTPIGEEFITERLWAGEE